MRLVMTMILAVLMVTTIACTNRTAPLPEVPKWSGRVNCCEALKRVEEEYIKPIEILSRSGNCLK